MAVGSTILADQANEVVKILEETVRIAEVRSRVGLTSEREVHLARADLAAAREAARDALAAQENAKRSLELLLGRYPGAELETVSKLDAIPPPVAAAFYKEAEARFLRLPRFSFSIGL